MARARMSTKPRRASAGSNPPRESVSLNNRRASPTMSQVRQYQAPAASNTMSRAQSNQIAIQQMEQRQYRAMPDRNTPAGYVSPYNQYQQRAQAQGQFAAQRYGGGVYNPPQPAGMGNVQRTGYTANAPQPLTQAQRINQASAGRYNAAYQQVRWEPDYRAAQQYAGYGSPSQGLTDGTRSTRSWQAEADRWTAQAYRDYTPPAPGGGGGGGGWVDWGGGGGGGGGGGYTERAPEWYERMAQWSYGKG